MKEDFDYKEVPQHYIHCLNAQCLRSADCLRFKIAALAGKETMSFSIVNPAYANEQEDCQFFHPDQLIRYAYGITHLYDNLPYSKCRTIKKKIYNYFGHSGYYRVYNKLLPIKPEAQTFIYELFKKEGIDTEPLFDEYADHYDFFPNKN